LPILSFFSRRDRELIMRSSDAQAIHALSSLPSPIVSSNLCKTVLVSNYFVRIRMEAALALISVRFSLSLSLSLSPLDLDFGMS
jgi:hypothetical protein